MAGLESRTIERVNGARKAPMPKWVEPMKATLVDQPFSREGWIFEDKYDGIRALAFIDKGKATLISRNQKEMTYKYPELAELANWVKAKQAILDGEIVVVKKNGQADFQELQSRFGVRKPSEIKLLASKQAIVYWVFDLLYLDGYDLRDATLLDRKKLLKRILKPRKVFQFAPHVEESGEKLFRKAEREHLEGILAKNGTSEYESRRSDEWLKIKTTQRQEAVVCGYTQPRGSREFFGALQLGLYDDGVLVSVGKVGTGFDRTKLKEIYDAMQPYRIDHPPFEGAPKVSRRWSSPEPTQWLKPKLVCEVRFSERTGDGSFRHPVFEGLRFDKKPKDCHFEVQHSQTKEVSKAEKKSSRRGLKARVAKPRSARTSTRASRKISGRK